MTIPSLLADYRSGKRTPGAVMASLQTLNDETYACAWICRVGPDALPQRARQLEQMLREDPRAIDRLPLYGVPFAVKDNIDVAGLPTTAACPAFSYVPKRSATAVEKLEAAGAILVGKTNLDQFATGLVGTRSPYGDVPNAFRPSTSPAAPVPAPRSLSHAAQVSFSLGTDTAGSGRVPAGFNNIVGLKPSRGLISARGVVPACQSLDCISVFALTVPDAVSVLAVARGDDPEDPWSRELTLSVSPLPDRFTFALPGPLEFYGDDHAMHAFHEAVDKLEGLGGKPVRIDFSVFLEAAALLYEGPWVAERLAAIRPFFESHADQVHPVVRKIIEGASKYSAADLFSGLTRLEALKKRAAALWNRADVHGGADRTDRLHHRGSAGRTVPEQSQARALHQFREPARPCRLRGSGVDAPDGLPFGITLIAPAGSDLMLADLAQRFHQLTGLKLGALDETLPPPEPITTRRR